MYSVVEYIVNFSRVQESLMMNVYDGVFNDVAFVYVATDTLGAASSTLLTA